MPEETSEDSAIQESEERLRKHGGYDWLLSSDKQFWSVSEIVAGFDRAGLRVSNDAVIRWIKPLPYTQDFGGPVGLRATKRDLIRFFDEMQERNRNRERKRKQERTRGRD